MKDVKKIIHILKQRLLEKQSFIIVNYVPEAFNSCLILKSFNVMFYWPLPNQIVEGEVET